VTLVDLVFLGFGAGVFVLSWKQSARARLALAFAAFLVPAAAITVRVGRVGDKPLRGSRTVQPSALSGDPVRTRGASGPDSRIDAPGSAPRGSPDGGERRGSLARIAERPSGPTGNTPDGPTLEESEELLRLARSGRAETLELQQALDDPDWRIRGLAALALGLTCDRAYFDPLRSAAQAEVERARHQRVRILGGETGPRPLLSTWRAMVQALFALDPGRASRFLLSIFRSGKPSFENYLANDGLAFVTGETVAGSYSHPESLWTDGSRAHWAELLEPKSAEAPHFRIRICTGH
jgi:hypothetical protein